MCLEQPGRKEILTIPFWILKTRFRYDNARSNSAGIEGNVVSIERFKCQHNLEKKIRIKQRKQMSFC